MFNYYKEEEILLEPERKFIVNQIFPPVNEIIHVRCEIQNTPIVFDQKLANTSFQKNESIFMQEIPRKSNNSKKEDNLKNITQAKTINKINCVGGKTMTLVI